MSLLKIPKILPIFMIFDFHHCQCKIPLQKFILFIRMQVLKGQTKTQDIDSKKILSSTKQTFSAKKHYQTEARFSILITLYMCKPFLRKNIIRGEVFDFNYIVHVVDEI